MDLYRYLTADSSDEYFAVMRVFSATLLADLSAAEASVALRDAGWEIPAETAEDRCLALVRWGNLIPSVRDARVPTVAAYRNSRARFQVSTLGGRVQRQAEEILHAADGAREVARELLGGTVEILDRILGRMANLQVVDAEALAADVTTVFNNQKLFSESARDFYTYLSSVLTRYDLVGEEYATLKGLLLEYVDLISNDVARHSPAMVNRLELLRPYLDGLVGVLADLPGLADTEVATVERLPGRARADWEELASWYTGGSGSSGPAQLRAAAEQALGQLITNAKRMLSAGGTGASRRADLLRLASLLSGAEPVDAHRAFSAAFGSHPARHLGMGPEEPDPRMSPTTSWWDARPVEVPVSLRERGDRTTRGRTSRVPDPGLDRARLTAESREEGSRLRAAVAELIAVGRMDGAWTSAYAQDVLLDYVGDFLAYHQSLSSGTLYEMPVPDVGMVLMVELIMGGGTCLWSENGAYTVEHLEVRVKSMSNQQTVEGDQ
ncbi:DUF2397 domain-containing protein [Streptomyces sp. NPDC087420]|uniref:DUF2397 domain-containing protein n=1 Tax=Streptomyces sp. NPDC087420 TaxID=3365785 RepID=UPI0038331E4A